MTVRALASATVLLARAAFAQADEPVPSPVPSPEAMPVLEDSPRLFLDCSACDASYIRKKLGFVAHVRDRSDADVHVIVSDRTTSAGGYEYTLRFLGRGRFEGTNNELTSVLGPGATEDETRAEIARVLSLGLTGYAARTKRHREISVTWQPPADGIGGEDGDPWRRWVMRLSGLGSSNGQTSITTSNLSLSSTAARVTELWKLRLGGYGNFAESRYDLGPTVVKSFRRDTGVNAFGARGLGDRFAAGSRLSWSSSTFTNRRSHTRAAPTVEWSIFPYSESTRRYLVVQYWGEAAYSEYYEETIFDKEWEILFSHGVAAYLGLTQPWGSISLQSSGWHYLHDETKANFTGGGSIDVRIVRGLSLSFGGTLSLPRDQIYLPKAGATPEEILLQRRDLETTYSYTASVGLSFTFGSIYTPVVNTRLEPGS